jgi:hypothetical protein
MVRADKRFITEKFGPMVLSSGEVFDIVNTKEKGELVYVKIVTDNPYAAVLLELDDYRNQEPNGETAAELIFDNRTAKADNQFFAIDGDPAKGYALVYNPMSPEPYDYKIRIQVLNLIRRSNDPFGNNLNSVGRGGLPSPARPIHMAGGSFTYPGLAGASLDTIAKAMAKPVGAQPYSAPNVFNPALFNDNNISIGAHTPYQGLAGRPVFKRDSSALSSGAKGSVKIDGEVVMTAEANPASAAAQGVKVLFGTQFAASGVNPSNFPGTPGSSSSMNITITDRGEEAADGLQYGSMAVGDRVFVRNGDTIHFPGVVTALGNAGTGGVGNQMTIEPGLANIPSKFEVTLDSETQTFGKVVTEAEFSPKILIKQIIIKRRKLVSFEG